MSSPVFRIVTNVIRGTQIDWDFSLRDHLYQDVSFCLVWDFCMHFNSRFGSACYSILIRTVISLTAILPWKPICTLLKSHLNAPFVKEIFVTRYSLFPCCTLISGKILINFEMRKKRKVCLLFLQRRIPFDCQLCEIWKDGHKHVISAQAENWRCFVHFFALSVTCCRRVGVVVLTGMCHSLYKTKHLIRFCFVCFLLYGGSDRGIKI